VALLRASLSEASYAIGDWSPIRHRAPVVTQHLSFGDDLLFGITY